MDFEASSVDPHQIEKAKAAALKLKVSLLNLMCCQASGTSTEHASAVRRSALLMFATFLLPPQRQTQHQSQSPVNVCAAAAGPF